MAVCINFTAYLKWISRINEKKKKRSKKKNGRPTNLNEGLVHSIKYMREQGVGIRKIATELQVGVGTIYKVLEAA